jgi:hypothetical protein
MGRRSRQALLAALIVLAGVLASSAGAGSGSQTFKVLIVVSGASGGRDVVAAPVFGRGAFNGVGRLVEIPNRPGDPDEVARDDLLFAGGTMHLVSVTNDFSGSLDPRTCIFDATIEQTTTIVGGTGRFSAAAGTFAATVRAHAIAARNADGSCSQERGPLAELDALTMTGTLSF